LTLRSHEPTVAGYSGGTTKGWCGVLRVLRGVCRFQSLIEGLGRGLTIRFDAVAT
jgi:hypothetical protein